VKEQTTAYLDKARELLDQAEAVLQIGLYEPAGRTAYLAGFHAAQALIFETTGRIYKSHGGLHGEFRRLVRHDPRVDDQIRAFLGRTYDLKAIADYLTGPGSHISAEMAREAVDSARQFVECITGLMPVQQPDADPGREPDHERDDDLER
jgi:uncharacterized protein (UPF0332 family)